MNKRHAIFSTAVGRMTSTDIDVSRPNQEERANHGAIATAKWIGRQERVDFQYIGAVFKLGFYIPEATKSYQININILHGHSDDSGSY